MCKQTGQNRLPAGKIRNHNVELLLLRKMASGLGKIGCKRSSSALILKEGFLYKKGHFIKIWSRKYFVLSRESLNYFKRENETQEPMGRVFLSDVMNITTEGVDTKRSFVFAVFTKRRCTLLQGSNVEDTENWVRAIREALETDKELERKDPFRKTLRRLEPGSCVSLYMRVILCVCSVCVCAEYL